MKKEVILIVLLLIPIAAAECTEPTDGMTITQSATLCGKTYDIPNGIRIAASDVVFDCAGSVLRGITGQSEIGVRVENANNVTIRNCNIVTFTQGLYLKNVTNSLIEKNGFLKNSIGVRLLDSYENIIRDNNDKSFQFAVSAISSKFNVVILGNKNVERAFCEVNACNEEREMNVCEAGDFYCSKKCTDQTDADCAANAEPIIKQQNATEKAERIIEETEKEVQQEFKGNTTFIAEKKSAPVWFVIYGFSAIIAIIAVIVVLRKKR